MNTISPEILKRRLELVEETAAHFNSNNRGVNKHGNCTYYPSVSGGCAIGRKITDKELCKELDAMGSVSSSRVFIRLPIELKELGKDFLSSLQNLHDASGYWNEIGLNGDGLVAKQQIIKNYCTEGTTI